MTAYLEGGDAGFSIGIVLRELKQSGILDAFFAVKKDQSRRAQIDLLSQEIQAYLSGDVAFGNFPWI